MWLAYGGHGYHFVANQSEVAAPARDKEEEEIDKIFISMKFALLSSIMK